jgi:1-acyl-sn-glycerol-3-phosphate acyltransferase
MLAKFLIIGLVRTLTGVRARWVGAEPSAKQRIYFANHTSNLDAVVIWASLPPALRAKTRPVAAQDYWTKGLVRPYLAKHVFTVVLIERKNVTVKTNPLTPMLAALDAGSSLIIFPEGGRMPGGEPAAFKSGIHHLATKRPDVELVPVWIDNVNRVLPKGEFLPVPMLGGVTVGAPLVCVDGETKENFLSRARSALCALGGFSVATENSANAKADSAFSPR